MTVSSLWKPLIFIFIILIAVWMALRPKGPQMDKAFIHSRGEALANIIIPSLPPRAKLTLLLKNSGSPSGIVLNKTVIKTLDKAGFSIVAVMHPFPEDDQEYLLTEEGWIMAKHFFKAFEANSDIDIIISFIGLPLFNASRPWPESHPKIVAAYVLNDLIETAQEMIENGILHAALLPDEESGYTLIKK